MSEKSWFVVIESKAVGPHSTSEIQGMLDENKLSYADFVYRAGLTQWTPISQMQEFDRRGSSENKLPALPVPHVEKVFDGWLLSSKSNGEPTQSGPYTKEQIEEKLKAGEILFSDLVWNKTFTEWKMIGELDDFNRRDEGDKKVKEEVAFLEGENDDKAEQSGDQPYVSVEASSNTAEAVVESVHESRSEREQRAPIPKPDPASEFDPPTGSHFSLRKKRILIGVFGASLGMLVAYVGISAYKSGIDEVQPEKAKPHTKTQGRKPTHAAVVDSAPTPERPAPLQLKIVGIKTNTPSKPQLVFETNLAADKVIKVKIQGQFGKILNYPRLEMEREVKVVAGQMPSLDLSKEDLPYGDYKVIASADDIVGHTTIKVGVHDESLSKKLAKFKAELDLQEKRERQSLLSAAQMIGKLEQELSRVYGRSQKTKSQDKTKKAWGEFYSQWRKDATGKFKAISWVEKQNPKVMIYPEAVTKYSQTKSKLLEISKNYNGRMVSTRMPASAVAVEDLKEDFKKSFQSLEKELKHLKK